MSLLMDYMPEYYSSNVNQPPKLIPKKTKSSSTKSPSNVFYILKDDQLSNFQQRSILSKSSSALAELPPSELSVAAAAAVGLSQPKTNSITKKASKSQTNSTPKMRVLDKEEIDSSKQVRIRNDLLSLLQQKPQRFVSVTVPHQQAQMQPRQINTFTCANKPQGLHRDPYDCKKYYFCDENSFQQAANKPAGKQNKKQSIVSKKINELSQQQYQTTKAYICPNDTLFNMQGCFCDKNVSEIKCERLSDTYCDFALYRGLQKPFA
jgi:hypothetical protein